MWKPSQRLTRTVSIACVVALTLVAAGCRGDDNGGSATGVTDDTIVIGGSFPFSGPLAEFGKLGDGVAIAFDEVNGEGGINGRQIQFETYDDAYDPSQLASNARKIVENDKAFAFIGFGGTNLTIRDYMKGKSVPQFVMAGNVPLSNIDEYQTTRAWWPDILLEGAITAKHVLEDNPNAKIGVTGLDNDITASQIQGIKKGLDGKTERLVAEAPFPPDKKDISGEMNRLKEAGANTLITGMTAPQGSNALKYLSQIGWNPDIYNYSNSSSIESLINQAGQSAKALHSVQWLKDPADKQWDDDESIQGYKSAVRKYGDDKSQADSQLTLNGYAFGKTLISVLSDLDDPTRTGLLKAWDGVNDLENGALLPGLTLNSGPDGRLIHSYRLTTWNGTSWDIADGVIDAFELGLIDKG